MTDVEIVDDLNDLKSMLISLINEYHGNAPSLYQSQVVYMSVDDSISEEHNVFNMVEAKFNNFMMPTVTAKIDSGEE